MLIYLKPGMINNKIGIIYCVLPRNSCQPMRLNCRHLPITSLLNVSTATRGSRLLVCGENKTSSLCNNVWFFFFFYCKCSGGWIMQAWRINWLTWNCNFLVKSFSKGTESLILPAGHLKYTTAVWFVTFDGFWEQKEPNLMNTSHQLIVILSHFH